MKNSILSILALVCVFSLAAVSCGKSEKETKKPAQKTAVNQANLPNYRYVDIDTILAKYNLAKDYNEEMMRMQGNLENEIKRHDNAIKSFGSQMQNKYQNNQYTEQSFNADQSKLQQMQQSAQSQIEKMQASSAQAAMEAEKVIQDSIRNFIDEFNATRHYDAILNKAATLYIDPALDITNEVVEGLNARYNKQKK